MKRIISTLAVCTVFCSLFSYGQAAKSVYGELGGPGLASINYDMRFKNKEDGLGFRVGIGGYSIDYGSGATSATFIPIGINYLLGKDNRNYFELGGGITFSSEKNNNSFNSNVNFNGTFGHVNIGYRLQPKNGGFLFRAGLTPIFGKGYFLPYFAGVSFGYKF